MKLLSIFDFLWNGYGDDDDGVGAGAGAAAVQLIIAANVNSVLID